MIDLIILGTRLLQISQSQSNRNKSDVRFIVYIMKTAKNLISRLPSKLQKSNFTKS